MKADKLTARSMERDDDLVRRDERHNEWLVWGDKADDVYGEPSEEKDEDVDGIRLSDIAGNVDLHVHQQPEQKQEQPTEAKSAPEPKPQQSETKPAQPVSSDKPSALRRALPWVVGIGLGAAGMGALETFIMSRMQPDEEPGPQQEQRQPETIERETERDFRVGPPIIEDIE